jgi:hypothetical protein
MSFTQRVSLEHGLLPAPPHAAVEIPRVMVLGTDSAEVRFLRRVLDVAGYWVDGKTVSSESLRLPLGALKTLFGARSIELLVLDGAGEPQLAARLLELIRQYYPALPIILIATRDAEVRSEARRVAVDIVLDAPVTIAALRRAARELAPMFPEPRADINEQPRKGLSFPHIS